MKIIHIVLGKANPERMNGVNKVAYQLATAQTNLGHEVSLWGIANSLTKNYPNRNFKTQLFFQLKNKLTIDSKLKKAIINIPQPTVVHFHGAFIPEFFHIARLLDQINISYVYTPHGSLTEMAMTKNRLIKKLYFKCFESRLIAKAKCIQLLGINEFYYLDHLTKKANKCMIANGQDLSEIPQYPSLKVQKSDPVFGFCGRLAQFHKGLDLMFLGFQKYLQNGGTGTLELIGDGKDRAALTQLANDLGISDQVIFHGKKFGKEKYDLLNKMDVFLHTSRMEGFPTAVLEAAALKIPTITSEPTNMNDFIRKYESGFLLNELSPKEICLQMTIASQHFHEGTLNQKGQNGRVMVEQAFDWKHIAAQLIEIYAA